MTVPVKAFVITRDRVAYAKRTVEALEAAGLEVFVVDHGSTWPPAVEWLREREDAGGPVFRRGSGWHPRDLWTFEEFYRITGGRSRYVVTDPDTPPAPGCPADWLRHMGGILDENPEYSKVGMALRLDNLPDHYQRKHQVLAWEDKYWTCRVGRNAFAASVDTTLALHQPLIHTSEHTLAACLRTDFPYVAEHLPWYEDFSNLSDEIRYYYEHSERGISFWANSGNSCHWAD